MKELSEAHQVFLEALFKHGGNVPLASEEAGFGKDNGYRLMHGSLRRAIIEQAENILVLHSPKAVKTLTDGLEESNTPAHQLKIKCAQDILDRVGIVKKDKLEISGDASAPLFILPAKQNDSKEETDS